MGDRNAMEIAVAGGKVNAAKVRAESGCRRESERRKPGVSSDRNFD